MLFCVYMDKLLNRLCSSGIGCHIGNRFIEAFSYANDLSLAAPSLSAAKQLFCICEDIAKEYDVLFNCSKSMLLLFNISESTRPIELKLNGNVLKIYDKGLHLGSYIGSDSKQI